MKIKDGFIVREVAGQNIVVAVGETSETFSGMIRLNETGRLLWDKLSQGCDEDALVNAVVEEYDVDEKTARADAKKFIKTLLEVGVLEH